MVNLNCSGKYVQVALAWVDKVASKEGGREITSEELVQDGPQKRAYDVMNAGSRWALVMMRLSVKMPNLIQCPPLPVGFN